MFCRLQPAIRKQKIAKLSTSAKTGNLNLELLVKLRIITSIDLGILLSFALLVCSSVPVFLRMCFLFVFFFIFMPTRVRLRGYFGVRRPAVALSQQTLSKIDPVTKRRQAVALQTDTNKETPFYLRPDELLQMGEHLNLE